MVQHFGTCGEQISLKENERAKEGQDDADNIMGSCGLVCCGAVDPEERG